MSTEEKSIDNLSRLVDYMSVPGGGESVGKNP